MKGRLFILLLSFFYCATFAQKVQTIVPKAPVVIGTAFQVQYVITQPTELANIDPPAFDSFTLVSGPHRNRGNATIDGKLQAIENITYTLVPSRLGSIAVEGLTAVYKNAGAQTGTAAAVTVVAPPKVSFASKSSYTDVALYAPASSADREQLINDNLFIRAEVNKSTCYVGEPVVASFKLYSRLQSSSEMVKVPALYGFSITDLLAVNEAHLSVETIGGKVFNTSVLRKVQLYPEQGGDLVVDAMHVDNEIEFDDSLDKSSKHLFKKELRSKPITIHVKPLPAKKPDSYTGAVGKFTIAAQLEHGTMAADTQGKLLVTIEGKGNFIQFSGPKVQLPKGLELYEPAVSDELNAANPSEGKRTYAYGFTADSTGDYRLPSVSFSYFDPASDSFKTLRTEALTVHITSKATASAIATEETKRKASNHFYWITALTSLTALLVLMAAIRKKRKANQKQVVSPQPPRPSLSAQLQALEMGKLNDQQACVEIHRLLSKLKEEATLTATQEREWQSIRQDCQLLGYASINDEGKKEELWKRSIALAKSAGA